LDLFNAGKAPLLVFTGGWVPWDPRAVPEGELLAGYAKTLRVPADRIVTTVRVTNTAEEALAVATLLRERRPAPANVGTVPSVLLVTSAFHMPRARFLFEREGLTVVPFPVGFQGSGGGGGIVMNVLPTAAALRQTELAWREMYGRLFYRVAGVPSHVEVLRKK
jgi:uncharacterized SAM-binding protein YcdF (DUF218 family)